MQFMIHHDFEPWLLTFWGTSEWQNERFYYHMCLKFPTIPIYGAGEILKFWHPLKMMTIMKRAVKFQQSFYELHDKIWSWHHSKILLLLGNNFEDHEDISHVLTPFLCLLKVFNRNSCNWQQVFLWHVYKR